MWGVIPGNKQVVLETLRKVLTELGKDTTMVPDYRKSTYAMVTENLLSGIGIETIITKIVAGQVRGQFVDRSATLDFLRTHWMSGTLPRWQTLQSLRSPRTVKQRLREAVHPSEPEPICRQTGDIQGNRPQTFSMLSFRSTINTSTFTGGRSLPGCGSRRLSLCWERRLQSEAADMRLH